MFLLGCPYGGVCKTDIKARPNFWGEEYAGHVKLYNCPEGYCCQEASCEPFNTCNNDR